MKLNVVYGPVSGTLRPGYKVVYARFGLVYEWGLGSLGHRGVSGSNYGHFELAVYRG